MRLGFSPVFVKLAGAMFSPSSLFLGGEQGVWYDPSDFSTMFQDSAGTTPVTAVGQSVGKMLDKSGRGNHAIQATAGSRPVLQQDGNGKYYLAFNGTSSAMYTASNMDLRGTNKVTLFAGVRKLSDTTLGMITELSVSEASNAGVFNIYAYSPGAYDVSSHGAGRNIRAYSPYTTPITNVISASLSTVASDSTGAVICKFNGAIDAGTVRVSNVSAGNFGTYPLYIGARAGTSIWFNGNLYSLIIRGAQSSASQIAGAERYVNYKTGAY